MKRPQKNFVVEYKGGSRRQAQKPVSIWGSLDLKSISRDMETEAQSNGGPLNVNRPANVFKSPPNEAIQLTGSMGQPEASKSTQEGQMAEESKTVVIPDVNVNAALATPEPRKRRGPHAKSAALEVSSDDALSPSKASVARKEEKVARKPRVNQTGSKIANLLTKTAVKQPSKTPGTNAAAAVGPAVVGDDIADLVQLEEENRNLRKLLVAKLRAENADLRKRLGRS